MSLAAGDLLFRYTPPGQMGLLQNWIAKSQKQERQRSTGVDDVLEKFDSYVAAKAVAERLQFVQHVGIYMPDGCVWEVGGKGFGKNPVATRAHYDIVVRFGSQVANKIMTTAVKVGKQPYIYPLGAIDKIAKYPANPDSYWSSRDALTRIDELARERHQEYGFLQKVVCSHAVHAMLYAAICDGTVAAATHAWFDPIFRTSPQMLLSSIWCKRGIFNRANGTIIGMQHKGNMVIDYYGLFEILKLKDAVKELFTKEPTVPSTKAVRGQLKKSLKPKWPLFKGKAA